MRLGLCVQVFYDRSLEEALASAAELGVTAIELPVDARSPLVDLEELLGGGWKRLRKQLQDAGIELSALSNHQEGQLLLGPHHRDTDRIHPGDASQKITYATRRLKLTAALAEALEVETIIGFTGCEDYSRWFPWPDPEGYAAMAETFKERVGPLMDTFQERGVRFAHECHPKQFAYNLETAQWALELLDDHPAFGFNLDPANLALAGVDPVAFVAELGHRIYHVHAKDCETVAHNVARSGLLAHGPWDRRDRGFRFRVPGWGDLDWRRLITELAMSGYRGTLAIEHEDPTMSRADGLRQAIQHLGPLLPTEPRESPWW